MKRSTFRYYLSIMEAAIFTAFAFMIGNYDIRQEAELQKVRPIIRYYDNEYECDIREGGRRDNYYIADCDGFYLVFDTNELYWYRVRDEQVREYVDDLLYNGVK